MTQLDIYHPRPFNSCLLTGSSPGGQQAVTSRSEESGCFSPHRGRPGRRRPQTPAPPPAGGLPGSDGFTRAGRGRPGRGYPEPRGGSSALPGRAGGLGGGPVPARQQPAGVFQRACSSGGLQPSSGGPQEPGPPVYRRGSGEGASG